MILHKYLCTEMWKCGVFQCVIAIEHLLSGRIKYNLIVLVIIKWLAAKGSGFAVGIFKEYT